MELVQEKYIQTEVGMIPSDWEIIKLEENVTLKARIGWQGLTTAEYLNSGDYCLVTGTDFVNGFIVWDNCVFVEKNRFDQDKNIQLNVEDVLVTKDGTIGKVAFVDEISKPTTLNSGVFVLRPKSPKIHNRFLYYVLMSFYFDDFLNKITAGSTITHLYQKDFVHFKFALPSLKEQTEIATALSDADNWINSLKQLIAKKRLIKQGAMQELLKPKQGWEIKKLGEIALTISSGTSDTVNDGELFPIQGSTSIIGYKNYYDYSGNNITVARVGANAGFIRKISGKYCVSDNTLIVSLNKQNCELDFIFFSLKNKNLSSLVFGSGQPLITGGQLKELEINIPNSIAEQTRIATILSNMDAEITALEEKLEKAKQVKLGMMQELLTGRIRLM
ncbi:restriction endonuclease subunit S [Flavobacterium oncorhynchi]|uniref:restriction endonuclease subunit S n=1 Tax=Flavobacterium oncorhynchi TaxID=728056 RepID=UPI00351AA0C8